MARIRRRRATLPEGWDDLEVLLLWPHVDDWIAAALLAGIRGLWRESLEAERKAWIDAGRPEPFEWRQMQLHAKK